MPEITSSARGRELLRDALDDRLEKVEKDLSDFEDAEEQIRAEIDLAEWMERDSVSVKRDQLKLAREKIQNAKSKMEEIKRSLATLEEIDYQAQDLD